MHSKRSTKYRDPGAPEWDLLENIFFEPDKLEAVAAMDDEFPTPKPGDFADVVRRKMQPLLGPNPSPEAQARADKLYAQAADRLTRRLGWFTRAHPKLLDGGRMLLGLYSDGFDFALAGISDDGGKTWRASDPIVGLGNVQPSFACKKDGTVVAYMRDNGPPPKRIMVAESKDAGENWGPVADHPLLPNPGAGLEVMNMSDGRWMCVYNDTKEGRHSLAVSISEDEGQTWPWTRHLESFGPGEGLFHYPSVIESRDGHFHVSYSYQLKKPEQLKSIKHAEFNKEWVMAGD